MRRLLNAIADWLYFRSPARIPGLCADRVSLRRIQDLEARMAAMEAVLDRIPIRRAGDR
jgi:hypothetical protein